MTTTAEREYKTVYMRKYRVEHLEETRDINRRSSLKRNRTPERTAYMKKYSEVHLEEKKAAARQWYLEHKAEVKEAARIWKLNHPEELHTSRLKYNHVHAEEKREKDKIYRELHPEVGRRKAALRRALIRGAEGDFTVQEFHDLCECYQHRCIYCGGKKKLTPDHKIPLINGGSNFIDNIVPACLHCNCSKRIKTFAEYVDSLGDDIIRQVAFRVYGADINAS